MAQKQTPARILRVGIVLAGHLIEERLIRDRGTVTVGQAAKNTFSVLVPGLPRSWPILSAREGRYTLHFTDGMDGRVSDGQGVRALSQLREAGQAQQLADRFVLPLGEQSRGKIVVGDLMILFQFVSAPPLQPRAQLPRSVKGRLLDRIDPVMAAILFFSLVVHGGGVGFVYAMDTPRELVPDEDSPHYVTRLIPRPQPLPVPQPLPGGADVGQPGPAIVDTPAPDTTPGKARPADSAGDPEAAAREEAAARGALEILGARGDKGDRFTDITGGKNPGGGLQEGLAKAREEGLGITAGLTPAGGTNNVKTGSIGTGSGPDVKGPVDSGGGGPKLDEGEIKTTTTIGRPASDDTGGLDAESVYAKIKGFYAGPLKKCYQDGLKSNSSLKGRVDVTFTVGPMGNVTSVEVDGFDSSVDACIQQNARRWRFDKPPGGAATFQFPFTFQAGS